MFELRYFLCAVLISQIDSERCPFNIDSSDIVSQSVENRELYGFKENNTLIDKDSYEDYELDKKQDIDDNEQDSAQNKTETTNTNNRAVYCNHTTETPSLEENEEDNDILNEDLNNRIDNDLEPTTDVADFLNKTTMSSSRAEGRNLSNRSIALYFTTAKMQNISDADQGMPNASLRKEIVERPRKMFFKSCREKDTDDVCRNTLIDYPYSVSIQKKGAHYATGALLNKRWILTVAGEFYYIRESIKFFRARLGSVNCKKGGVLLPLQEVSIHPLYVPDKPGYDLGLLKLSEAVNFTDYIQPIRLSSIQDKVLSAKFLTNYWARLIVKGELLPHNARERIKPNSMRVSTQRLISWKYCNKMMLEMNEHLQDTSLCLKPLVTHHSLCMPDAGAPVVADDGLWGITSGWTSKLCYSLPGPTIFTRVSSPLVRSWIDTHLLGV